MKEREREREREHKTDTLALVSHYNTHVHLRKRFLESLSRGEKPHGGRFDGEHLRRFAIPREATTR